MTTWVRPGLEIYPKIQKGKKKSWGVVGCLSELDKKKSNGSSFVKIRYMFQKLQMWRYFKHLICEHMLLFNIYIYIFEHRCCQIYKLPVLQALMHPPYHQRCRLLNWELITSWILPFPFSLEEEASMISKKNIKFWSVWSQDSFPLCLSPFQMSFGKDGSVSGSCSHVAALRDWASTCICKMARWTVFTDSDVWKFVGLHGVISMKRIISVFNAEGPEGLKITGI